MSDGTQSRHVSDQRVPGAGHAIPQMQPEGLAKALWAVELERRGGERRAVQSVGSRSKHPTRRFALDSRCGNVALPVTSPSISVLKDVSSPAPAILAHNLSRKDYVQHDSIGNFPVDCFVAPQTAWPFIRILVRHIDKMPLLKSVILSTYTSKYVHGIRGWPYVRYSPSPICASSLCRSFASPRKVSTGMPALDHIASDVFSISSTRLPSWTALVPSERHALELIIEKTYSMLETLTLQSKSPRSELRLRGIHVDPPSPVLPTFSNMPRLRVLELKFLLSEGCDFRWPLLPPAYAGPWPWPDLQHLTVSCPELGDKAWNHLPPTLQSLTLRYTPHLCDFTARGARGYPTIVGWQWPLLSSSQVLQLLRRCDLPALRHLGLEYSADGEELELLEFIGSAFPAMASLKIYRYRASEVADVPVPLGAHTASAYDEDELRAFVSGALQTAADTIARDVPAVDTLRLWVPDADEGRAWATFDVGRGEQEGGPARARLVSRSRGGVAVVRARPAVVSSGRTVHPR
ncbi:hypothetical protein BC628DRAFT_1340782 [Trametes gibbosa]|nr:hypothetical protein BC628DRAFT_1340782 [Trametes gibbosa]